MFLALTALEEFWDKDKKILFLGEWSKPYSQIPDWQTFDYEVLEYHWNDRAKYLNDFLYLQSKYEKAIKALSGELNAYYGENNSERFYRIFLGPWLRWFLGSLLDRFYCLKYASEKYTGLETNIPEELFVPADLNEYIEINYHHGDYYNLQIYGQIIKFLELPVVVSDIKRDVFKSFKNFGQEKKNAGFKSIIKEKTKKIIGRIARYTNKICIFSNYLPLLDNIKLHANLMQMPVYIQKPPSFDSPSIGTDSNFRKKPLSIRINDDFDKLMSLMLPLNIPKTYLEHYKKLKSYALEVYPEKPKLIMTANCLSQDDGFLVWCADKVQRGAKLVSAQHGGGCGTLKFNEIEKHEVEVSDHFLSWGWKNTIDKVIPLYMNKNMNVSFCPQGKILMIGTSIHKYPCIMFAAPVGSLILEDLKKQMDFLNRLGEKLKNLIVYRLYYEIGWDEEQRLRDKFKWLKFEKMTDGGLEKSLSESRLALVTYNATIFMETFSQNFPTVMLWDQRYWENRPAAEPYYQRLVDAGILYYDAEKCAARVEEIYEDPMKWWMQKDVQAAKNLFCAAFARRSADIVGEYIKTLKNI